MSNKLDKEEQDLLHSLENEKWEEISNFKNEKKRYGAIARNTFTKNKRVNLRLSERDFEVAHSKALMEGMPYQTLLASIIHKYLTGKLKEV